MWPQNMGFVHVTFLLLFVSASHSLRPQRQRLHSRNGSSGLKEFMCRSISAYLSGECAWLDSKHMAPIELL